jgi:alanine dehydrogenase
VACERAEDIYRGADIVAAVTDSSVPVLEGRHVEKGAHLVNIGGGGWPDAQAIERVDVYLRFGNTPAPLGREDLKIEDEYLVWAARPDAAKKRSRKRSHGVAIPDKLVYLADLVEGRHPGRTSNEQITWSERGNLQGAQFFPLAGLVYEKARAAGLGHTIPTEWLLQDIRD